MKKKKKKIPLLFSSHCPWYLFVVRDDPRRPFDLLLSLLQLSAQHFFQLRRQDGELTSGEYSPSSVQLGPNWKKYHGGFLLLPSLLLLRRLDSVSRLEKLLGKFVHSVLRLSSKQEFNIENCNFSIHVKYRRSSLKKLQ